MLIFRELHFNIKLHEFQVCYWVSFAQQHGVELHGGSFVLSAVPQLTLLPVEDGLIHRKQADWSMQKFTTQLDDVTVWLCSSRQHADQEVRATCSVTMQTIFRGDFKKLSIVQMRFRQNKPLFRDVIKQD